ncbi:LLM class oxidoreductase [Methylobacterium sp. E-045]|uniref:LLM class oxidoreductase n=1 Tax=Methylobacterium sp. E-045 TaxID=2836575 RepID=UPI001FBB7332|nr:LLM class oxidoreductase [Methylobacterium sp. E-045]MCJ2131337.1 LLM class oxidoreductase [Methylobacterium sp. E-045]
MADPTNDLATHRGFDRVFRPGRLTFGFIAPLEGYPDRPAPTMQDHAAMARKADQAGFAALWLRDVPFYDPSFGDVGQVFDPMVYAGWLAAETTRIAIGTAGIILPLRDPVSIAKQATSLDHLTGNRFLLGLSTGDRPVEYPAFGTGFEDRAERFRDAREVIRVATEETFPRHRSVHYGTLDGSLDLIPKPVGDWLPTIAIGRCGQTIPWLAGNMDGWIWHQSDFGRLGEVVAQWNAAVGNGAFKPYGYGSFFDLDRDPGAPLRSGRGIVAGRRALVDLLHRQRDEGVSHVAFNLKIAQRPTGDVLDELAEHVLPLFGAA